MNSITIRRCFPWIMLALVALALWSVTYLGGLEPAEYTIVNGTEVKSLDPAQCDGTVEGRVVYNLFEGLYSPSPVDLSPLPGVAERHELSDNDTTYRFYLRPNARWSDGTPVTAHDFVWSFRRMLHPTTASTYSYELWYVVNAARYTKRELQIGDAVEIEVAASQLSAEEASRAEVAPFEASHRLLHGKLLSAKRTAEPEIKPGEPAVPADKILPTDLFTVEIAGQTRTFQADGKQGERFAWLLLDFDQVPIRALDDLTLEVKLQHPVPYFLDLMAFYPFVPVPRKCIEQYGVEWTKPGNMVCNGPFCLELRRLRERIRLTKNERYWDAANVKLKNADFLAVEGQVTALNLYLTGQADWIEKVPSSIIGELRAQKRPDYQPGEYITTNFYRLNVSQAPMNNKLLRQALNLAIDKQQIVDKITRAGQQPARNIVSQVVTDHDPALCPPHNIEEAKRLYQLACDELRATGMTISDSQPLRLSLQFNNSSEQHMAVAEFIQDQWQQNLGVQVELNSLEWGAYQKNMKDLTYQVSRAGWVGDYKSPNTFLKLFTGDSTQNQTGWSNQQFDDLVKKAEQEGDATKRREFYHQAEAIMMEEMPVIPLFFDVTSSMSQTYVRGVYPNYHDVHPLKSISIDQAEKQRVLNQRGQR